MAFNPRELVKKLDTVAGLNRLLKVIKTLDDDGRKTILSAISGELTAQKKNQVMNMIRNSAGKADEEVRNWLIKGISETYVAGMNQTVKNLQSIKFKPPAGGKALQVVSVDLLRTNQDLQPHLEAVNTLLSDAYLNFGNTMQSYVKGAERILNDTLKRQVRSTIAEGRLEGSSVAEIKKTVKSIFEDQGFTVLIDRGGRKWELANYSEMLVRTQLLSANNEGVINRASDFNVDIVEISDHNSDCPICSPQEGKIYSISGKSENYEALGDNEPPYHPHCKHTLLMRPDLQ